jgi:FMN phosphatase YigB (HAD superfamily)
MDAPFPVEPIVFLVDIDNTLLDNDRIQDDIQGHFDHRYGVECRERYWQIQEAMFVEIGYRDYLGALQRYRDRYPQDLGVLSMGSYLLEYPFAERLYPGALEVLEKLRACGRTVILSDGDVVFQPRKVQRSGIAAAVDGHVLIYIHKEQSLEDVERRYPAHHYVLIDDKPQILSAVKSSWGQRVTTVLPRQGKFASDPSLRALHRAADLTVERIGDLLAIDLPDLARMPAG